VKSIAPPGWHIITPRLFVNDTETMVRFLKRTFDATGSFEADRPSIISIGDSMLMVSDAQVRGAGTAFLYVYVADVDETYERAITEGATSMEAPQLVPYGDRRAMVRDPWGNTWQIATRNELL
jgi:PhnB protein